MTTHVRQQIRDQVVTYLTGLTTTGTNVFKSRPQHRDLQPASLPCLLVYTDGEDNAPLQMGGPSAQLTRSLRVKVEAVVLGLTGFDDTIDLIVKEVETALNASTTTFTINNLARGGIFLHSIEDPEFDGEGAKVVGRVVMQFMATYRTVANAPQTAI